MGKTWIKQNAKTQKTEGKRGFSEKKQKKLRKNLQVSK